MADFRDAVAQNNSSEIFLAKYSQAPGPVKLAASSSFQVSNFLADELLTLVLQSPEALRAMQAFPKYFAWGQEAQASCGGSHQEPPVEILPW